MKRILVAVDGSPRAQGVVDVAIALAARHEAGLLLLRAVTISQEVPQRVFAMTPDQVAAIVERDVAADLATIESRIPRELRLGVRVAFGTAWEVIDRVSEAEDVDLIVIGSHGYGGFDRIVGTTAAKVVNHATRSVLVVRAPERISGKKE